MTDIVSIKLALNRDWIMDQLAHGKGTPIILGGKPEDHETPMHQRLDQKRDGLD